MPELTVIDEINRGEIFTLPMQYSVMNDTRAQIVSLKGQELTIASAACIDHLQKGMRFSRPTHLDCCNKVHTLGIA